jgi:hypothetical protein
MRRQLSLLCETCSAKITKIDHTQESLVRLLAEHRPLRPGIDVHGAVDTFFAVVNSYTYELLVRYCSWTPAQWQDWLVDLLERELFG